MFKIVIRDNFYGSQKGFFVERRDGFGPFFWLGNGKWDWDFPTFYSTGTEAEEELARAYANLYAGNKGADEDV